MVKLKNEAYFKDPKFPFYVESYLIESNRSIFPHSHEFIELAFIAEGMGNHRYKGTLYPISTGDIFIIEPGIEHDYEVGSDSHLLVYNVLFLPSLIKQEIEVLSKYTSFIDFYYIEPFLKSTEDFSSHLKLLANEHLEMRALIDHLILEQSKQMIGYETLIKTRLIELLIYLSRWYQHYKNSPMQKLSSEDKIISQICKFIEKHYDRSLTLEQISNICGMSPSSFATKFKGYTGKTFIEYRNEVRINQAKNLLNNSEQKVSYIAQEVGFQDLSFFNKQFKIRVGSTPGKYRKAMEEKFKKTT